MTYRRDARVAETSTTTGTGNLTLGGAYDASYRTFGSVCTVGDTFKYVAVGADGAWERGIGTYSAANTLSRSPIESTNANALVNFTTTPLTVFLDAGNAEDAIANAPAKAAPLAYTDKLPLADSAAGNALKSASVGALMGGGALDTTTTVLTNASARARRIVPTTSGCTYQLPDATTMPVGEGLFALSNPSSFYVHILDSTGVLRGWIAPYSAVDVSLADNSTAAGGWTLDGAVLYGIGAVLAPSSAVVPAGSVVITLPLDSTRRLLVFGGTTVCAVIYDSSTNTFGTVVTVRSGINNGFFAAALNGSSQCLVASCNSTTGMQAVVLSLSGATITVNTAANLTLAGNITAGNGFGQLIACNGSFVLAYNRATTVSAIVAMSISGTTVTFGAEVALSTTGASNAHLYVSGTTLLCLGALAASSTAYAKPYTISGGTTLTAGTAASFGTSVNSATAMRSCALGTRWLLLWNEGGSSWSAAVISLAGTTATASVAASVITGVSTNNPFGNGDLIVCNGRALILGVATSASAIFNIVRDVSGTATAGTAVSVSMGSGVSSGALVSQSGTTVRGVVNNTASTTGRVFSVDCSGNNPVVASDAVQSSISLPSASMQVNSTRAPNNVRSGGGFVSVSSSSPALVVGQSDSFLLQPFHFRQSNGNTSLLAVGQSQVSDYESWFCGSTADTGALFQIMGAQP